MYRQEEVRIVLNLPAEPGEHEHPRQTSLLRNRDGHEGVDGVEAVAGAEAGDFAEGEAEDEVEVTASGVPEDPAGAELEGFGIAGYGFEAGEFLVGKEGGFRDGRGGGGEKYDL
jgi:hypothetical protein